MILLMHPTGSIRHLSFFGLFLGLLAGAGGAWADTPSPPEYLIGAVASSSVGSVGESDRQLKLRPFFAFEWGRWRVATGRASELLSLGRDTVDPGLSTVLLDGDRWRVGSSLQIDDGRSSRDDPLLQGLPDIRSTLRGRLNVSYRLDEHWSMGSTLSQDLLGRDGGTRWSTSLRYRAPLSEQTYWDASVGTHWGSALFMQSHYGVPASAARPSRDSFAPGSGWESWSLGVGLTSALSRRWVLYGGLSATQLQGPARRSPLVTRKHSVAAQVGLAYRGGGQP